ncbi:MAG: 3-hydroxyacyl-CoA dehydrogenase family protein [Actinomycetota bacterium]|nr:3-hydroxyacyl-CoA dehydrogenase family protein [Actinomycetota bacterium]
MSQPNVSERLGIAGTGTIACGLARLAAPLGEAVVWARSDGSAERARDEIRCGVGVTTDLADLAGCTYVVEAVVEDAAVKGGLLRELDAALGDDAVLATTTSSLSVAELAAASGRPERFAALHVFNPVERMDLVELAFAPEASADTRERTRALCEALGKTPVEVPDVPGFVVNRLLFPYLFSAVRLMEEQGLAPEAIDACMKLGAGHPTGPLKLLDFVGLDVAAAIGDSIGEPVPGRVRELVSEGALGRKSGRGFYEY